MHIESGRNRPETRRHHPPQPGDVDERGGEDDVGTPVTGCGLFDSGGEFDEASGQPPLPERTRQRDEMHLVCTVGGISVRPRPMGSGVVGGGDKDAHGSPVWPRTEGCLADGDRPHLRSAGNRHRLRRHRAIVRRLTGDPAIAPLVDCPPSEARRSPEAPSGRLRLPDSLIAPVSPPMLSPALSHRRSRGRLRPGDRWPIG